MNRTAIPSTLALALFALFQADASAQGHADHGNRCTPEHAAMGHCTLPPPRAEAASAQAGSGGDPGCTPEHAAMGHCTLPAPRAEAASAQADTGGDPGCTPEHAAMGHCTLPPPQAEAASAQAVTGGDPGCTPEHAAMGHCTLPPPAAGASAQADAGGDPGCTPEHAAMGHCTLAAAADPDCPPEHAAMGHCTPRAPRAPGLLEPREPIPAVTEVDRAAAFPVLHADHGHGSGVHWLARFNRFEAWDADHGTGQAWSGSLWLGGDVNRLRMKTSGERIGGTTGSAQLEALYSRSVTPWWDLVAGAKQEFQPDSRTWAAVGVQGLAPYMFEVSAMAYAGDGGQVQLKTEVEYEILFSGRLILQPVIEVTASLKDEPEHGIGAGLGKLEAGLRLRYEFTRRFAPYVGVAHERALGNTADIARSRGGHLRDTRVVAGVRFWF